jgi:chromate transporter
MKKAVISWRDLVGVFVIAGARSFGGWSTTALYLERELVAKRQLMSSGQLRSAVTYAQILPGATQVAIVSGAGFRLRGLVGSLLATTGYLLPVVSLITGFAALYFHFAQGGQLMEHLDGLIAALGGVILANAYRIGQRHVGRPMLWLAVVTAVAVKLLLDINAVVIILSYGLAGLICSFIAVRRRVT